jgi:hypothetical protein
MEAPITLLRFDLMLPRSWTGHGSEAYELFDTDWTLPLSQSISQRAFQSRTRWQFTAWEADPRCCGDRNPNQVVGQQANPHFAMQDNGRITSGHDVDS